MPGSDPATVVHGPVSGEGTRGSAPPLRSVQPPNYQQRQLWGVLGVTGVAVVLSLLMNSAFTYGLLHSWMVFAIVGLGFYLVFGLSGQFAFSQGAFFGLGAYASVWASDGRSFAWGMAGAVVITAVVAAAFALLVWRSDHFYFAIATLAFGFMALVVFREFEAFTAPGGEIVGIGKPELLGYTFDTDQRLALFLAGCLGLALLLTALIERSPLRRQAIAFRDNPVVASTLGLPVLRMRIGMFVLGSTYAGVAGSLFAHKSGFISTESFSLHLGIDIFLILLLGGVHSMWGPVLGAAFVVWAPEQLRFVGEYRGLIYGALLLVVIVGFPDGLVGLGRALSDRVRRFRERAAVGGRDAASEPSVVDGDLTGGGQG